MIHETITHYIIFVVSLMWATVLAFFTLCIIYVGLIGGVGMWNRIKYMYRKWILKQCPHLCIRCKFKNICDYKKIKEGY